MLVWDMSKSFFGNCFSQHTNNKNGLRGYDNNGNMDGCVVYDCFRNYWVGNFVITEFHCRKSNLICPCNINRIICRGCE